MSSYLIIAFVGAIAQIIDGGIGMGYGAVSASLLLTLGFGAATVSATIHIAKIFTTLISGTSHLTMGNVDKKIFFPLASAGIAGGVLGTFLLVFLQHMVSHIEVIVAGILFILGLVLLSRFIGKEVHYEHIVPRHGRILFIGFIAALIDSVGGGGWGNVATPSLILNKSHPRKAIGSVNLAEFFVTVAISISFFFLLPSINWQLVVPLIAGSILVAPFSAYITKKLPLKGAGIFVGILIVLLSIRTILRAVGLPIP